MAKLSSTLKRKPRVLFVSADTYGCGFYRCFMPGYFLQEQNLCETRISGLGGEVENEHIDWADVIIFQRIFAFKNTAWHYATLQGKRILTENDDLYSHVPAGSMAKRHFPKEVVNGIHQTMRMSDGITVTTDKLKEAYGNWGVEATVVPNALDMRIDHFYPNPMQTKGKIIIGYHGSATHTVDFSATVAAMDTVMQKYPFLRIHALGFLPEQIVKKYPLRITIRPWVTLHKFFNEIRALQTYIGIAPIDDCQFNHAKSNLKLIEYATIRTPWIASKVGPYIKITEESGGGLLVKNKYKDWLRAFEKMINMPHSQRQEMGLKARKYVEKNFDITKVATLWFETIQKAMNKPINQKRVKAFENIMFNRRATSTFKQIV